MTMQIHASRIDAIRAAAKRLQNYRIVPDWSDDEFVHGIEVMIVETFGSDADPGYEMGALHDEIVEEHARLRIEGRAEMYTNGVLGSTHPEDMSGSEIAALIKQAYLVGVLSTKEQQ